MDVREALEKIADEKFLMFDSCVLAGIIERALRASANEMARIAGWGGVPADLDICVTAGVAVMMEEP